MATDVAEAISLETGLDYRTAYRVVGRAAGLDSDALEAAAEEIVGRPLGVDVSYALDPVAALATRTIPGGAAPAPMDAMLDECQTAVADRARVDRLRAQRDRAGGARAHRARSPVTNLMACARSSLTARSSVAGRARPARSRFAHDEPDAAISSAVAGRASTSRRP